MKILVAGAGGQLARALVERAAAVPGVALTAMGRPRLDVREPASIARAIAAVAPDLVVNAAAYTGVDAAEREPEAAFAVNAEAAGALAAAARAHGCPIVHVSTDYVFDGAKAGAYCEGDTTGPLSVYGRSKLAGEAAVAAGNARHIIVRTAWLYSPFGHNFLKTILRLARERSELRVVADQRGNPTNAHHLADAILATAAQLGAGSASVREPWGIYHAAGSGATSWHGFATAIVEVAARGGARPAPVRPIGTADYPLPARRPANSALDCSKLARTFGVRLPHWRQGVEDCIAELAVAAE